MLRNLEKPLIEKEPKGFKIEILGDNNKVESTTLIPQKEKFISSNTQIYINAKTALTAAAELYAARRSRAVCVKALVYTATLSSLATGIAHLIYSAEIFNKTVGQYNNQEVIGTTGSTCGNDHPLGFPDRLGQLDLKPDFFNQWITHDNCVIGVSAVLKFWEENPECLDAIKDLCEGPGMWTGYTFVIILFGIVLPLLTFLCSLIQFECNNKLSELGAAEEEITLDNALSTYSDLHVDQPRHSYGRQYSDFDKNTFRNLLFNAGAQEQKLSIYLTGLSVEDKEILSLYQNENGVNLIEYNAEARIQALQDILQQKKAAQRETSIIPR